MVWELRLSRIVEILFTKKSQNLCGRSADGIEDGRDEVFDLPRRVFVMLNNCLDEVHARILVLKNVDFACCTILLTSLQAEQKICLCTSRQDFNHCLSARLLSRLASRSCRPTAQNQGEDRRHRTRAEGGGCKPCAEWQGRADPGGSAAGDAAAQQKVWCRSLVRPEERIGRS